ncbi:Uncharacterized conserved protein [Anoxybacillus flavithermus WK1]|nr:Uncharacterized conserved protein [Anoxybacillus flavithermus WK1]
MITLPFKGGDHMTSDNDKKAKDNNAKRHEKNMEREKNRQAGKRAYSKETNHL